MFFLLATAMAQMQAATETIDLSKGKYYDSSNGQITWSGTYCYVNQQKGSSSTTNVNQSYVSAPRWYASHVITFAAVTGYKLTGAEVVCETNAYATALKNSTYSNDASASVSSSTVTITANGDFTITMGAQSRPTSIKITYESDAPAVAYTVTLGDDNTKLTESSAGAGVTLPSRNNVGDYTFVGWSTSNYTEESTNVPTTIAAGKYNPKANVTLYPMYKRTGEGQDAVLSQTLQYDTWTYSGATSSKSGYRLFGNGAYVESESFDLSKLTKVVVYGGTYGGAGYNSLTISDGTNTWKSGIVSGTSNTGKNEFTEGSALSGTGKLRITSNSGDGSNNGVRISKVEIYTLGLVEYYISTPVAPVVKTPTTTTFGVETVTKTVGDAKFTYAATLEPAEAGAVVYSSSNTSVATVDTGTGEVTIVGAGTTTIKAEFAGNDDYEASSAEYTLTVNAAALVSIKVDGNPNKSYYKVGEAFVHKGMWVIATFSDGTQDHDFNQGVTWSYDPEILTASTQQVTVTATVAGLSSSKSITVYVSKNDASVAVETVEVEVGKTATISATTTPAEAALTYTVTEGADKISIADGVITGVAEGTATVKATFAGNDEYNAAETTFTVNVIPERHEATIDLSTTNDISGTPTTELIKWEKNGFVITNEKKNEKSTDVTNYYPGTTGKSYTSTRFYNTHTLTITPADGRAITKVEYTATTQDYATTMAGSAWTNASASADGTTVTITPTDGTEAIVAYLGGTTGGTSFTIYYEDATPVVRTLDHITVSGAKTEFKQGDKFSFGGKVMASYEETDVADRDVTGQATFSGYDMNVAGTQTVTVSYTEGEITKTATYDITVAEVSLWKIVVTQPTGGTLKVYNGDVEVQNGDMVAEGTELSVEATPATGYAYDFWQVSTDRHSVIKYEDKKSDTYKLEVGNIKTEARAVFSAKFKEINDIVYSWSANGTVTTQTYAAGTTVTAPANPANITVKEGDKDVTKVFVGWVTTSTVSSLVAPEYVTDFGTAQENKMYYAVYATATQGGGTGDYYEKIVDPSYSDWTNGEYLLVHENSTKTEAGVFNGLTSNSGSVNVVAGVKIDNIDGKLIIKESSLVKNVTNPATTIKWKKFNSSALVGIVNVDNDNKFIISNKNNNGLVVKGKDDTDFFDFMGTVTYNADEDSYTSTQSYANTSFTWNTDHWQIKIGKPIVYFDNSYGFRAYTSAKTELVHLYVKKAGVTYSAFTTGDAFKGEFKLVTSAGDLVAGREYIIVSNDNSHGIFGLSVDDADSRTAAQYDEEGHEIPKTDKKTSSNHRRAEQDVTLFNGIEYASIDGKTSVLTLEGAAGAWKFNSAAGYLTLNANAANLTVETVPATENTELTNVTIADNKAVIKFNKYPGEESKYRYIFLNYNAGYPRFAAYSTDGTTAYEYGKDIYLYYREADPTKVETLADIEANGIDGTVYTIADELEVVKREGSSVWVRDHAKSYAYRENTYPGVVNYLSYDYDQNNWIELKFTDNEATLDDIPAEGAVLKGATVKGTYNGYKDRYHTMSLVKHDGKYYDIKTAAPDEYNFATNTYTMASFWEDNTYDYVVAPTGKMFFLMNPKIEEYCLITDAVWNGTGFVVPAPTVEDGVYINQANLKGAVKVDWSLNGPDIRSQLANDKRYQFNAIVTKGAPAVANGAPAKVAPLGGVSTAAYTVYPIGFVIDEDHIVTEIEDVTGAKTVVGVRYYDVAGHMFNEAQPGLNIIVTDYSDGSHSAVKVIR